MKIIKRINDQDIIKKYIERANLILEKKEYKLNFKKRQYGLNLEELHKSNWCFLPIPETFNHCESERLSVLIQNKLIALNLEEKEPSAYEIPNDTEALFNFSFEHSLKSFLIFDESENFIILTDNDLYTIIASEKKFLEQFLSCSLKSGLVDFQIYASPAFEEEKKEFNVLQYIYECAIKSVGALN